MEVSRLQVAARAVAPALNIDPNSLHIDAGFVSRALKSTNHRILALRNLTHLLVFLGIVSSDDPGAHLDEAVTRAVASLPDAARNACEQLIVAWASPADRFFAAAYELRESNSPKLLGCSWLPSHAWAAPTFDGTQSPENVIEDAFEKLADLFSADHLEEESYVTEMERWLKVVDTTLQWLQGEPVNADGRPSFSNAKRTGRIWLDRYIRSVRDEIRRAIGGSSHSSAEVPAIGPLKGMNVFISYARPEAAALAWPVRDALQARGAIVWLDQTQAIDAEILDAGLEEAIAACDAFVVCASDEFLERAGYGNQELVWALRQLGAGKRLSHYIVVTKPNTLLPTAVSNWPLIEVKDGETEYLAEKLCAALLDAPTPSSLIQACFGSTKTDTCSELPDPLIDLSAARLRAAHCERFYEIDTNAVARLAAGTGDDRRAAKLRLELQNIGEKLEWSGRLNEHATWPADSIIRDMRWRLGTLRAIASTRWPLIGDLKGNPELTAEIELLAEQPVPITAWPTVVG